jgi:hypothetical protein
MLEFSIRYVKHLLRLFYSVCKLTEVSGILPTSNRQRFYILSARIFCSETTISVVRYCTYTRLSVCLSVCLALWKDTQHCPVLHLCLSPELTVISDGVRIRLNHNHQFKD